MFKFPMLQNSSFYDESITRRAHKHKIDYKGVITYRYTSSIRRPIKFMEALGLDEDSLDDNSVIERIGEIIEEMTEGRVLSNQLHFFDRNGYYELWVKYSNPKVAVRVFYIKSLVGEDYIFGNSIEFNELPIRKNGSRLYSGLDEFEYYMIANEENEADFYIVHFTDEYLNSNILSDIYKEAKVIPLFNQEAFGAYMVENIQN